MAQVGIIMGKHTDTSIKVGTRVKPIMGKDVSTNTLDGTRAKDKVPVGKDNDTNTLVGTPLNRTQ